jgi:hypothetical protein
MGIWRILLEEALAFPGWGGAFCLRIPFPFLAFSTFRTALSAFAVVAGEAGIAMAATLGM